VAKSLDELDYYALLRVPRDASVDAIKAAFRAFAVRYHPDQHAGDDETAAKAARVYRRGTEAYRVLTHPEQRVAYDKQLDEGKLRFDPEQAWQSLRPSLRPSVAPGHAVAQSARARPFVARAEQAFRAGDYKQAKLNLKIALQHEPGNESLTQKLAEVEALLAKG
jgi:DnaJ-class molecular chaperone